jgi:FkbM family methyltransferase
MNPPKITYVHKELSPHYVSQHREDQWLDRCWESLELPDVGFFIEFGAADGVMFSNTYWLEQAKGWIGLLCEPDPRHVIRDRPKCIIERVAVGEPGTICLGQTADPCLSGKLRVPLDFESEVRAISQTEVPSVPLSELLDRHNIDAVDLISIDTEGTELEAWRTLDLNRWRPRIAIVELITWGLKNRANEIVTALDADGYRLVERTYHNGIFLDTR